MRQPDEVLQLLHQRFADQFPVWARGKGTWPMRVSLQPPSTEERSADAVTCHRWAEAWRAYRGPGELEYQALRFPTATHRMPVRLTLARAGMVAAANAEDTETWQRCGMRLTDLQREFPKAALAGQIRRITDLGDGDFRRLVATSKWLRSHPSSGMYLRQLPIEGISTKWLAKHAALVLSVLGDEVSEAEELSLSRKRALHYRLGLRVVPELVQVSVCDPELRRQFAGMRHFAATVDDLNAWFQAPRSVVILENKETGFALDGDYPGTVVLHGHGAHVEQYARIRWVRDARQVIYWGDIDGSGLEFLSELRGRGVNAQSILMDLATLTAYRHLAVEGSIPRRTAVPLNLTLVEQELYVFLEDQATAHGTGILLEQERIPWDIARRVIDDRLSNSRV